MNKKSITPIFLGIALIVSRYLPTIHIKSFLMDKWFSMSEYLEGCNSLAGIVMENCNIVSTINTVLIVLGILSLSYGIYLLLKK